MTKIRWGILSTARIGTEKVIPAMQKGLYSEIVGIASRDIVKSKSFADKLNIPKYYGSYEALLSDDDIDAVYISLPNHLHIEWAEKSLHAGKHVLCEKPIGLNLEEALYLESVAKQFPQFKIMEAFMYRFHPQWKSIRTLINDGIIGDVQYLHSAFMYHNINALDIRNQSEIGGGGLLDIGCYCISLARFIFQDKPQKIFGSMKYDAKLKIDKLTSGILEFASGRSTFTCSTQLVPSQHATIFGSKGKIEIDVPFTPPPDAPTSITVQFGSNQKTITFEPFNQYTAQGDFFSLAILKNETVPTPFTDAVSNMRVLDSIVESAAKGIWINTLTN